MYRLTLDPSVVLRLADGAFIPADGDNSDYVAYQQWLSSGNTPQPVPPEVMAGRLELSVQAWLDSQARALGYDDIRSAVTYADEPAVPKFAQEGQQLRRLRSLVWAHCYQVLAAVEAGHRGTPTEAELLAELEALLLAAEQQ